MRKIWAAMILCCGLTAAAGLEGWKMAGDRPADYDVSVDTAMTYQGQASSLIRAKPGIPTPGFGTLLQSFPAGPYVGKRVRFGAAVRSSEVNEESWATLWMRADGDDPTAGGPKVLGFTNLRQNGPDRAIRGTTEWKQYSVVLDIPAGAKKIYVGFALHGSGAVWMSGNKFEVVGSQATVTTPGAILQGPTNLGFEKE